MENTGNTGLYDDWLKDTDSEMADECVADDTNCTLDAFSFITINSRRS